jgi:hypothetical protein
MATIGHVTVQLIPWDDPAFVAAFERASDSMRDRGVGLETPAACQALERLLRAEGYPDVRVDCDRDVAEALSHQARIVVHRGRTVPGTAG